MSLLEKSIIESFAARRLTEAKEDGADGSLFEAGRPKKKTASELKKMGRARKKREMKATNPKRSAAMKKTWRANRKAMLRGWISRKKVYGSSGTGIGAMGGYKKQQKEMADLVADLVESGELTDDLYKAIAEAAVKTVYSIIKNKEATDSDVYEAILFDVAPVMTIVEALADRDDMSITERDQENLESYLEYSQNEISEDTDEETEEDDE